MDMVTLHELGVWRFEIFKSQEGTDNRLPVLSATRILVEQSRNYSAMRSIRTLEEWKEFRRPLEPRH